MPDHDAEDALDAVHSGGGTDDDGHLEEAPPPALIPDTVLVVGAHPDDIDFGCSGTIATWVDAGSDVHYVVLTDGQAGGFEPDRPRDEIPGVRRAEQRAAAEALGVSPASVRFLGHMDGELTVTLDLRRDLSRVIREVRPDRLVCQSPVRDLASMYGSHPDHLAAGEATLCAVYPDARNPFAHPTLLAEEGLEPHAVAEVWIVQGPDADTVVDITDVFDRKLAAIRAHASQLPEPGRLEERLRGWNGGVAEQAGLPDGRLAERFQVLDTR